MNQREIKFRAWDGEKMWKNLHNEVPTLLADLIFGTVGKQAPYIENWKIMQFTGLKDKNGKEIYEGDIVEDASKYDDDAGKFEVKYEDKKGFAGFGLNRVGKWNPQGKWDSRWHGIVGSQRHLTQQLEVIGNIYESKHLLDK